ncbi:breast carcinoma-amplified sequence 1 isoform X2 [Tachysurus fulvidraco]|uniref:breast carcinoma-amplified sequence 1 isoform X2 n=1 Tax=Tachysurus fulvidraco TaxID=1234273 RepID=UPI001FEF2F54|nr:breast carcinoma-amplified sequence 1 isoform X2 [Tachysurus fulvidraco]
MGNRQSVNITHQTAGHDGIQVKKDEANGHTMSGLDLTDAVTSNTSVKQNTEPPPPVTVTLNVKPTPASVEANGTKAKAPTMSVKAAGNQVIATTVSTDQKTPAESSTPAKDAPKQLDTPSMFKMFKKKSEANMAAEAQIVPAVQTESQKSQPAPVSVKVSGTQAKADASVEFSGTNESTESSTPAKDAPKQVDTRSMFKMFKKKTEANMAAEAQIVPAVQTESQKSQPAPVSVKVNGTQAKADASVEFSGTNESTESSTPAKDAPKQLDTPSMFKMFKRKTEANMAAEAQIVPAVQTESQKSQPAPVSVKVSGTQAKADASVEFSGTNESTESSTPAKDAPKQVDTPSMFKMFKRKTEANMAAEAQIVPAVQTESQKSQPTPVSVKVNGTQAKADASVEFSGTNESTESSTPAKDAPKQVDTPSMFKMFKKKTEANMAAEAQIVPAVQTESQKSEPTDIKTSTQAEKVPQGEAPKTSTTEVTQDTNQPEQSSTEEKSVMNFFKKTFVTSPKTTKEATASPDVSKDQSKKETPPAPAANEAAKVPPPPPPAPPKMESKAEPAVKKDEAPLVEVAATVSKEQDTPSKTKTKDSPFGKLFRTKALLGKMVSKGARVPAKTSSAVDASKTSTLEAGAKAEPPPATKPEEKKAEKKPSPFANLLKPKVLLGQVSAKIHAAASSAAAGISLGAGGAATEPKKETPAATTAPAVAAPSTKAKEEPKPAAPAALAAASQDNKSVGSTDNSSPSTSRKLEKRNSIQLFFKNLGQKRHSDAEVQTETVAPEKAK